MRARKTVLTAAVCAAVCVVAGPSSVAFAGTGPAPAPSKSRIAKSTAPSEAGNPLSSKARAAGVCLDAYQIGTTAYIDKGGQHAASVKQFYSPSCKVNFGYVWVWESYRNKVKDYDVTAGVYNYATDKIVGKRSWTATNAAEFWSYGADTASVCTSAVGTLRAPGEPQPGQATTSKRC